MISEPPCWDICLQPKAPVGIPYRHLCLHHLCRAVILLLGSASYPGNLPTMELIQDFQNDICLQLAGGGGKGGMKRGKSKGADYELKFMICGCRCARRLQDIGCLFGLSREGRAQESAALDWLTCDARCHAGYRQCERTMRTCAPVSASDQRILRNISSRLLPALLHIKRGYAPLCQHNGPPDAAPLCTR